ncbi:MAG: hypothetical protein AMS25_01770 [Gemmatimonas sp. SM23_52]|nr:MAG: hypothetical protein AMS25_01770 [Gemmatimonas sp. SM23_52]
MQGRSPIVTLSVLTIVLACSPPKSYPVPDNARNPIEIRFRGATAPDVVSMVATVCSDNGLPTLQVVPGGYVETVWVDIAEWEFLNARNYPAVEREVQYRFEVAEGEQGVRTLSIATYYQPSRPPRTGPQASSFYDRFVPTDHPGYRLALRLADAIRLEMTEARVRLVREEQQ